MKKFKLLMSAVIGSTLLAPATEIHAETPDSVWVYLYTNLVKDNHDGLHWAWSPDRERWVNPAPGQKLVSSDYGTWGAQKRMLSPFMTQGPDGTWYALWSINESDPTIAIATSKDLINWKPQSYPPIGRKGKNCIDPELTFDKSGSLFTITWLETDGKESPRTMMVTTRDFKNYTPATAAAGNARLNSRTKVEKVSPISSGTLHRISREHLRQLVANAQAESYRNQLYRENTEGDKQRFSEFKPQTLTLNIGTAPSYPISDKLIGIFFEDISRAADGGLYAELIQNRDFEYTPTDLGWDDPNWNPTHSWTLNGTGTEFLIDTDNPIHPNNPHYAVLNVTAPGASLANSGFEGIAVKKGEKYNLSLFTRSEKGSGKLKVSLKDKDGNTLASASVKPSSGKWGKQTATLMPSADAADARLEIEPTTSGRVCIDMVSLFPGNTFHGRRNGLRRDLAQTIADLNPRFVRFPGGCVTHGDGIENIYRWKNTIGPLESRKPMRNIWNYHQSMGLGYHEYFEFCEDLGAEPLPVVAAGVPCQNSSRGGAGQQGGIPMDEMDEYAQDILDLIEYANGDAKSTVWGRKRAENGHPAPFNLKYVGIGNEDLISDVFEERFKYIYDKVSEKHPEITVVGTAGPFHSGSDYDEGWRFATELEVPLVDEHYYESPGWFINNQHYYDGYDRKRPHVYLGEYASRGNTLYNALAEATYLCNVERNADVVEMTSYAPLLAKEGQTNWNPDLIYFTNTEVNPTPNYYVQRLFGQNQGSSYVPSTLIPVKDEAAAKRIAYSVTEDGNGEYILKMTNILPIETTVELQLPDGEKVNSVATEILTGDPTLKTEYNLTKGTIDGNSITLPPYSFVVAKIK